jgi:DNA-repair protein complementing XP-A cells
MELTEEQRERIRQNRERALEIQRRRRQALIDQATEATAAMSDDKGAVGKKRKIESSGNEAVDVLVLEDFEVGASEWVTKKEAVSRYCLQEGTLAVCKVEERQNPHNKRWKPVKLYLRAEIRRRARERFGGLEGLQEERRRREQKRFSNDLERTRNLFQSKRK